LEDRTNNTRIASRQEVFRKADGSRFVRTKSGYIVEVLKDGVNLETVEFQVCLFTSVSKAA